SGLASLTYARRFPDDRLLLVPLQYLALTMMLLTSMVTDPYMAGQIPIGGYRSFVLLALLPGGHLYFEMNERSSRTARFERRILLLVPPTLIVVFAILVRGSVGYVLIPAGTVWLWRLWRERRDRQARIVVFRKAALATVAAVVTVGAFTLAVPAYVKSGRTV